VKKSEMDGKAVVDSLKKDIIEPGIRRLMETRYFTEMRLGKLSVQPFRRVLTGGGSANFGVPSR
jgi:hypothetical protein